jgi:hypothetical protein
MAICKMLKVMIVNHPSEAAARQEEGIVDILDAQRAMITKEWPESHTEVGKPKDLEEGYPWNRKTYGPPWPNR